MACIDIDIKDFFDIDHPDFDQEDFGNAREELASSIPEFPLQNDTRGGISWNEYDNFVDERAYDDGEPPQRFYPANRYPKFEEDPDKAFRAPEKPYFYSGISPAVFTIGDCFEVRDDCIDDDISQVIRPPLQPITNLRKGVSPSGPRSRGINKSTADRAYVAVPSSNVYIPAHLQAPTARSVSMTIQHRTVQESAPPSPTPSRSSSKSPSPSPITLAFPPTPTATPSPVPEGVEMDTVPGDQHPITNCVMDDAGDMAIDGCEDNESCDEDDTMDSEDKSDTVDRMDEDEYDDDDDEGDDDDDDETYNGTHPKAKSGKAPARKVSSTKRSSAAKRPNRKSTVNRTVVPRSTPKKTLKRTSKKRYVESDKDQTRSRLRALSIETDGDLLLYCGPEKKDKRIITHAYQNYPFFDLLCRQLPLIGLDPECLKIPPKGERCYFEGCANTHESEIHFKRHYHQHLNGYSYIHICPGCGASCTRPDTSIPRHVKSCRRARAGFSKDEVSESKLKQLYTDNIWLRCVDTEENRALIEDQRLNGNRGGFE